MFLAHTAAVLTASTRYRCCYCIWLQVDAASENMLLDAAANENEGLEFPALRKAAVCAAGNSKHALTNCVYDVGLATLSHAMHTS